jgi:Transmembrane amino acid transporter protein
VKLLRVRPYLSYLEEMVLRWWFGGTAGSDDNPTASRRSYSDGDVSISSGEEELSPPNTNHERRPLIAFHEEPSASQYSETLEDSDHYKGMLPNFSNHSATHGSKRGTRNMMDNSYGSINSNVSGISQRLKDQFLEFRSTSQEHIRRSVRMVQSAIAEHTGSIGMLGSLAIAINNLTGPAMLSLPATFSRSGIIPTTLTLLFVCFLSSLCSLHMANVISKVPENKDFQQGVEFPEAFRTYWGYRWFVLANGLFFACITVLNVSSLVDNAQVLDTFLGHCNPWGGAWAFAFDIKEWSATISSWDKSVCSDQLRYEGGCIPFANESGEQTYILTIGYLITAVLFFPLALMDLTENVAWQILGFMILLITSTQFIVTFALADWEYTQISWWGESYDNLLGVVFFNFALVITVPAWLYEKEPHVDIPTVLHASTISSAVLYILIGILGCVAMPGVSDNFLESIMSGALGPAMQFGASIFAFFIIGMNIPLFSILTRLSLMGGGNELRANTNGNRLCSRPVANILAVYLPFGLSWTLYQGSKVTMLISWGGMIFTSLVAFLLPLALALYVVQTSYEDCQGYIRVYPWKISDYWSSKESQVRALKILLFVSSVAVAIAIVGNVLTDEDDVVLK